MEIIASKEANKLIAENCSKHLKSRLEIARELVKIKEERGITSITMKEYQEEYLNVSKEKSKFTEEDIFRVKFSDTEQEEIIYLIKTLIERKGIGNLCYAGNFSCLISQVISLKNNQYDSLKEETLLGLIKKWQPIIYGKYCLGLNQLTLGDFRYGYNQEFVLMDSQNKIVCQIGLDGINKKTEIAENSLSIDEDIFLSSKLWIGSFQNSNNLIESTLFLEKENNQYKDLLNDKTIYFQKFNPNLNLYKKINPFLKEWNLSYYEKDIYSWEDLAKIILTSDNQNLLPKETLEKISKIAQAAANWWSNIILIENEIKREKFINTLYEEIRLSLICNPESQSVLWGHPEGICFITADFPYYIGERLERVMDKAQIEKSDYIIEYEKPTLGFEKNKYIKMKVTVESIEIKRSKYEDEWEVVPIRNLNKKTYKKTKNN